jgi:hypothetical protein
VLDAAFAFAGETGERIAEHELHRLRGECLLMSAATRSQKEHAAEQTRDALAHRVAAEPKQAGRGAELEDQRLPRGGDRDRPLEVVARSDAANDCADARIARALLGV